MDIEQAVELALEIKNTMPSWTVVAIGRFVPIADIKPDSPIGISVLMPGETSPRVLWSISDYHASAVSNPEPRPQEAVATSADGFLF